MSNYTTNYRDGILVDETLSANFNMEKVHLAATRIFSFQIHIDNTNLVGSLGVEVSNDGDNWIAASWSKVDPSDSTSSILVSSEAVTSGTDVDLFIRGVDVPATYFRVTWTHTSGSGKLSVFTRKVIGK